MYVSWAGQSECINFVLFYSNIKLIFKMLVFGKPLLLLYTSCAVYVLYLYQIYTIRYKHAQIV